MGDEGRGSADTRRGTDRGQRESGGQLGTRQRRRLWMCPGYRIKHGNQSNAGQVQGRARALSKAHTHAAAAQGLTPARPFSSAERGRGGGQSEGRERSAGHSSADAAWRPLHAKQRARRLQREGEQDKQGRGPSSGSNKCHFRSRFRQPSGGTAAEAARVKQPYTKAAARGCALQGTARCEQPPRCCGLPSQPPLIFFRLSYLSLSPLSALPSFPPPLPVKRQATRMALLSLRAAA